MKITGATPYSPSKYIDVPKKAKESHNDYEIRTWRERCNYNEETRIAEIPAIAFAKMVHAAAKYQPIQHKGVATYTKFFERGLYVPEPLPLNVKVEDVDGVWLMVPSDGRAGGGKRVKKCFPIFRSWGGVVTYQILDDTITPKQFEPTLQTAAAFIGLGRFRPEKCGWNGRFIIDGFEWE